MSGSDSTRASLLSRVRDASDGDSWREFDELYRDLVVRYARRQGLQAADAEDVCQLVMLGLSRSLRGFEYRPERGRFRDYLGRVVYNAIARFRRGWRPTEVVGDELLEAVVSAEDGELDEVWEQEWTSYHFRRAMAACADRFEPQSLAIFERLVAGSTTAEVAAAFDVSVEAVYKIRTRVRERLMMQIEQQVREEDLEAEA